jgi:hypothetical protein
MKQLVQNPSETRAKIWSLDLGPIMFKLMATKDGKGWSREKTEAAVESYRRFLFLTVTQGETIVPSQDADEVWHTHILDTRKYREDCGETFGFFLDHFPYFGMRSDEDQECLQDTFQSSKQLEASVFSDVPLHVLDGANCATCGGEACGTCAGSGISLHTTDCSDCTACSTCSTCSTCSSCSTESKPAPTRGAGIQAQLRPTVSYALT